MEKGRRGLIGSEAEKLARNAINRGSLETG